MPSIGSNELDQEAIALLNEWIVDSLPARLSYPEWRLQVFGSADSPEGAPDANPDGDRDTNYLEFLGNTDPINETSFIVTTLEVTQSTAVLGITLPANRSVQVDTSTNLILWSPWNAPGNQGLPLPGGLFLITGPALESRQFFRFRIFEH
jgi:hypothetical protein